MFASRSQLGEVIRRAAAAALVLWLGGLGCLAGCETGAASAPMSASRAAQEGVSCPVSARHACCHGRGSDAGRQGWSPVLVEATCCPLAGQSAAVAKKETMPSALAAGRSRELPAPDTKPYTIPQADRPPARDRGGTYLLYCVFLI